MLISRYFTRAVRAYGYAIGEVVSIAVFGFTFAVLFLERSRFQFGLNDPGMARATASCFIALSVGMWVICNCLKQIDKHD